MIFEKLLYLLTPKKINLAIKEGKGKPVVLLHGLGSDSKSSWDLVSNILNKQKNIQVYAFDLLGFGQSSKPEIANYSLKEQAKLIEKAIKKQKIREPITLVGHSMGSLISIEIASRGRVPIKKMILCSPPIFQANEILNRTDNRYSLVNRYQNNAYFKVIETITNNPKIPFKAAKFVTKTIPQFNLTEDNWKSFKKSLINSIFFQDSFQKLKSLNTTTVIMYGIFDVLIIPGNLKILTSKNEKIKLVSFKGGHSLSPAYAKLIVKEINF